MIVPLIAALGFSTLQTLSPQAASEDDIADVLTELEVAWIEGDLDAAAKLANRSVNLIEVSACPLRQDAAIAAFMGAVASFNQDDEVPTGYLFWVASTIDERLGGLPPAVSEVALELRDEPGETMAYDALFIRSAYRGGGLTGGCASAQLEPDILLADPENASRVFIALHWSNMGSRRRPGFPDRVVYTYPLTEGRMLAEQVIEMQAWPSWYMEPIGVLVLDPCAAFTDRNNFRHSVCREDEATAP